METLSQKIGERVAYYKSAFIPRKIEIHGGEKKGVQAIQIHYRETQKPREENMIDIRDLNKPEILNYKRVVHTTQKRSEAIYDPWQMCFMAMVTPKTTKTIKEVQDYWKFSYRQAVYVSRYVQDFKSQKALALDYYMSLLKN